MPALAIAAIGAAATIGSAEIQSNAIGNAQDQQLAANEKARQAALLGSQQAQQILQQQQQRSPQAFAPYIAAGNQALGKLGVNVPPASSFASQFAPPPSAPVPFQQAQGGTSPSPSQQFSGTPLYGSQGPAAPVNPGALQAVQQGTQAGAPTAGTVLMEAPTGERQRVPQGAVAALQARGARVVPNGQ